MSSTSTISTVAVNKKLRAVGYRFHPTDEELLTHFLKHQNLGHESQVRAINVVNVCKCEPWDLPDQSKIRSEDHVWYFFCPRNLKYSKSKRLNRTTEAGYWKPTGNPRKVTSKRTKMQIGTKRTLVFYLGHPKGTRTEWVMHEYDFNLLNQGNFVVCKLQKKPCGKTKNPDVALASDFETDVANSFCDEQQSACQEAPNVENECQSEVPGTPCCDGVSSPTVTPSILLSQIFFSGETTPPPPPPPPPPTAIPSILDKQISVIMQPFNQQEQIPVPVTPSNHIDTISATMTPTNYKNQVSFRTTCSSNIKHKISMTSSNHKGQILSCGEATPHSTKPSDFIDQTFFCSEATPHAKEPFDLENQVPNNIDYIDQTFFCSEATPHAKEPFYLENQVPVGGDTTPPITGPNNIDLDEKDDCIFFSDFNIQNLAYGGDELTPVARSSDFRDEGCNYLFTSNVKNQISDFDFIFDFDGGKWITAINGPSDTDGQLISKESVSVLSSNLEHKLPHNDLVQSCMNPPLSGPSSSRNEQEHDMVEPNYGMEHDLIELNSSSEVIVPVTQDGESGSLESTISGFETQSTYEKTIVSTPEDIEWSSMAPFDLVSNMEFDTLLEENWVNDPEDMFGSELQWLMFGEVSPWAKYSGFDNSMPGSYDVVHVPSFSLPA